MTGTLAGISAILLGTSLFVAGSGLLSTALGLQASAIGFAEALTGAIMAAYFLGYVVGTYGCPRIVRAAGHVRAFSAFAAVAATAVLVHTLTENAVVWLLLRFVTGASVVGLYMVIESWLNERSANQNRGRVFAVYQVISLLALALGQYFLLLPAAPPTAPLVVAAALFSIGLVPVVLTRVEHPRPIASVRLDLGALWRISPLSVIGTFVVALGNSALMMLGPVFAQQLGFGTLEVVVFMSLVFAGGLALQWPIGHLSDLRDRRGVIVVVSLAAALLALLSFMMIERSVALFFATMFAYGGAAFTLYPLCIANANDHCEPSRYVATASGLLLVYGIGAAVGPLIAGVLLQVQGPRSLPLFLAATQLALALFASLRKLVKASPPPEEREPFVMLSRSSQSALDVLAPAPTKSPTIQ